MSLLDAFTCFNNLPKELRLEIWEFYFAGPRIHVLHPAPTSRDRSVAAGTRDRDTPLFHCTILDSSTNRITRNDHPCIPITREARAISISLKRQFTPVRFAKDFTQAVTGPLPMPFPTRNLSIHRADDGDETNKPPPKTTKPEVEVVYINWNVDLIYLCVPDAEQAFWALRNVPWRRKMKKLALLVPESEYDRAIAFGPTGPIREVLESIEELEELFLVLRLSASLTVSDDAAGRIAGLRRDRYGFAPYVDYLKIVGLHGSSMGYTRSAMSFRSALAGIRAKEIELVRVVDVDSLTCAYGEYERRLCQCRVTGPTPHVSTR